LWIVLWRAVMALEQIQLKERLTLQKSVFPEWSLRSLKERVGYLKKIRKAFYARVEDVVRVVQSETGKVLPEIYGAEIIANLELFDFYIKNASKILKDEPIAINPLNYPGKKGYIQHRPLGIVGVLSSWNYPVALPLRAILPALVAGNCVAFKPSVDATLIGQTIAEIFESVLPKNVFLACYGGREVSNAIIEEADKINFIGSVSVGKQIAQKCASRLIPCSTELSGKDAAIVLEDCDFERTVNGILWGAFTNAGQNCASIERLYVVESLYDRFVEALTQRIKQLEIKKDIGPLRNEKQMALVLSHVESARKTGSKILTGGKRIDSSLYFEPTLIEVKDKNAEFMIEETFGPTLPVVKVKDIGEAVRETNSSKFGLTTSLWTRDIKSAEKWAAHIQSGVILINNCVFTGALAAAPWGGMKETGHGVTNSKYGLLEMTRPHFILMDRSKAPKETWWYPYSEDLTQLMKAVVKTLGGRVTGYFKLPGLLKKVGKKRFLGP